MGLRTALSGMDGLRFVAPSEREEQVISTGFEARSIEADTIDRSPFTVYDVPVIDRSGFTHFLDGAQRSWPALYHGLSPIYISHTSAAVLERHERELLPPDSESYRAALEAFVPEDPILVEAIRRAGAEFGLGAIDVPVKDVHPGGLDEVVRQAISDRRDHFERDLAQRFESGRLLIDGGIGNALRVQGSQPFVVGLVKSHRKQYFRSTARTAMILGMKPGQRSSLFERPADSQQGASVHSFYLRLRESDVGGPLFGTVRVEVPAEESFVGLIDEIAGWILHERDPLSLPDPRFDKLLYPIRLVEQHLKARQPTTSAIMGLIG